jgi:Ca-activated chloride channel family protein
LALPASLQASPASALKEYNAGEYQEALKDYNQLLENKKDDPRLHFNAGTAAYQSHQLDAAAKEFSDALSSPDLQLQERAYYNLGNTQYRAGQQLADADKKKEAWENALKGYSSALKLNPQDADAKFNQQFVTRQLEELKKQQQQQQKQQNKSDKNQDKKDQPKQDQNNQSGEKNQDQQKEQSSNDQKKSEPDKSESQKNSQAGQDQQKSDAEKQKEEKQNAEKKPEDGSEPKPNAEPQSANGEPKEKSAEEAKREAAMMAAGQMTPRQAQQLLDSHKDDEKVFQIPPPNKQTAPSRNFKNW